MLVDSIETGDTDLLLVSDRKELDFLTVKLSFRVTPFSVSSSCAKIFTARDSGFGFSVGVSECVACG